MRIFMWGRSGGHNMCGGGIIYVEGEALHQKKKRNWNISYFKNVSRFDKKIICIFFSSKVFKITWKMRSVLKQMKNNFSVFYISRYGFSEKSGIWFFFRFSTFRIFQKNLTTSEGGVCISLVGKYWIEQDIL